MTPIDMGDGTGTLGQGGLRNVSTFIGAIPDSVVLRYPADEGSGQTLNDEIGNNDMGLSFDNWISGDYVGGAAPSGDGVDDDGTATMPDSYADSLDGSTGFSFVINTTDSDGSAIFAFEATGTDEFVAIRIGAVHDDGKLLYSLRGDDGNNDLYVGSESRIDDGEDHTVTVQKEGNNASDVTIFVDGVAESVSVRDESPTSFTEGTEWIAWDRYFPGGTTPQGNNLNGVLDDIRLYNTAPTDSESQAYHDNHPSS